MSEREGEVHGDLEWDAELLDGDVWVWCDDGAGREVHSLAHEVAADATVLELQTVGDASPTRRDPLGGCSIQ